MDGWTMGVRAVGDEAGSGVRTDGKPEVGCFLLTISFLCCYFYNN